VVTYTTKVLIPIKLILKRVQGFLPLTGVRLYILQFEKISNRVKT